MKTSCCNCIPKTPWMRPRWTDCITSFSDLHSVRLLASLLLQLYHSWHRVFVVAMCRWSISVHRIPNLLLIKMCCFSKQAARKAVGASRLSLCVPYAHTCQRLSLGPQRVGSSRTSIEMAPQLSLVLPRSMCTSHGSSSSASGKSVFYHVWHMVLWLKLSV